MIQCLLNGIFVFVIFSIWFQDRRYWALRGPISMISIFTVAESPVQNPLKSGRLYWDLEFHIICIFEIWRRFITFYELEIPNVLL